MFSRLSFLVSIGLLAGCHDSSSGSSFLPPGSVTSLGFAAGELRLEDGVVAALGDVLHVVDLRTGREVQVPDVEGFSTGGGVVACTISEARALRDLNRDGDLNDAVLHVIDMHAMDGRRGVLVNLGIAADPFVDPVQSGRWIAFGVPESDQGGVDLDGDGEALSTIAHVYDAARGTMTDLEIPVSIGSRFSLDIRGSWLIVEGDEDLRDLNGDGGLGNSIVFAHDLETGTTENLLHAIDGIWGFDGHMLAIDVSEFEQGEDLNGNGQTENLVEIFGLDSGRHHLVDIEPAHVRIGGGLAFVQLDGAGTRIYDEFTDTFTDLGDLPIASFPELADRRVAYLVEELRAGDLNGDGDEDDEVMFVFDARTGTSTNTGAAVGDRTDSRWVMNIDGESAAYLFAEPSDEDVGDPDWLARVRDLRTGVERVIGPADDLVLRDGLVTMVVPEDRVGQDLDGDHGLDDLVLQIHDPRTGRTFDTGLAVDRDVLFVGDELDETHLIQDGRELAFLVPEVLTHLDGNHDGDNDDLIVFAARVP